MAANLEKLMPLLAQLERVTHRRRNIRRQATKTPCHYQWMRYGYEIEHLNAEAERLHTAIEALTGHKRRGRRPNTVLPAPSFFMVKPNRPE